MHSGAGVELEDIECELNRVVCNGRSVCECDMREWCTDQFRQACVCVSVTCVSGAQISSDRRVCV